MERKLIPPGNHNPLERYRPRPRWIRYLDAYLALFLGTLLLKVKVIGRRHLLRKEPFIVAINHFSRIDPALIIYALRRPIDFLAASDQAIEWFLIWAPWLYGFIPTNRLKPAPSTIKAAIRVLKSGGILGIFPEGTSTDSVLRRAKNGVVYFSTVTAARILPVSVIGLEDVWIHWLRGVRPRVTIRFGKPCGPFTLPRGREARETALSRIGDEVMGRIAALLPEEYRGAFAHHQHLEAYRKENA